MKYVLRLLIAGMLGLIAVATAQGQSKLSHLMQKLNPLLSHSQGYLGVLVGDVDNETASRLKLRDAHGAVVTLIDHDAPAGPILRVNDVVLQVNGQNIENAEQFSRMLREVPAGHKVTLLISRDGTQQTATVELCDRKVMEQNVWNKMNKPDGLTAPSGGMALMPGGAGADPGMHMHLFTSTLHVGAVIEPLTGQMADYLGVTNGVIVKHIDRKSEAEAAGLKPFDVILKVGVEPIKTAADWDRALRANEGKTVQVTVLRERKQQTVNLQVDSKRKGELNWNELLPDGDLPQLAQLEEILGPQSEMQSLADELQKHSGELSEAFTDGGLAFPELKMDPKQMDVLKKQIEQLEKNFSFEEFRIDPKQMEELDRQMQQWRKALPQTPCTPDHFIRYEGQVNLSRPA